jgi:hypothetical protein
MSKVVIVYCYSRIEILIRMVVHRMSGWTGKTLLLLLLLLMLLLLST